MDRERVFTSVIASVVTAAVLYSGALIFEFFTITLNPTDIPQVARAFINDDDARDALLSFMARDEGQRFHGPKGEQGPRGEQGPVGAVTAAQSGSINMEADGTRELRDGSKCPNGSDAYRGTIRGVQKFEPAFNEMPVVTIALSQADVEGTLRLGVSILDVTREGFEYNFTTYCNTQVYGAKASWIAISVAN